MFSFQPITFIISLLRIIWAWFRQDWNENILAGRVPGTGLRTTCTIPWKVSDTGAWPPIAPSHPLQTEQAAYVQCVSLTLSQCIVTVCQLWELSCTLTVWIAKLRFDTWEAENTQTVLSVTFYIFLFYILYFSCEVHIESEYKPHGGKCFWRSFFVEQVLRAAFYIYTNNLKCMLCPWLCSNYFEKLSFFSVL